MTDVDELPDVPDVNFDDWDVFMADIRAWSHPVASYLLPKLAISHTDLIVYG